MPAVVDPAVQVVKADVHAAFPLALHARNDDLPFRRESFRPFLQCVD